MMSKKPKTTLIAASIGCDRVIGESVEIRFVPLAAIRVDNDDLNRLLALCHGATAEHKEDPIEELIEDIESPNFIPRVQQCDIWRLGRHFLACGDSTDVKSIKALLRAASISSVDCCWTDPPYGVSYVGKTAEALMIQNDSLTTSQLEDFLQRAFLCVIESSGGRSIPCYVAHPAGELHSTGCFGPNKRRFDFQTDPGLGEKFIRYGAIGLPL